MDKLQTLVNLLLTYISKVEISALIYYFGAKSFIKEIYDSGQRFKIDENMHPIKKLEGNFFSPKGLLLPFFNIGMSVEVAFLLMTPYFRDIDMLREHGFIANMTTLEREVYSEKPDAIQAMLLDLLVKRRKKIMPSVQVKKDDNIGMIYYKFKNDGSYEVMEKTGVAEDLSFVEVDEILEPYVRPIDYMINILNKHGFNITKEDILMSEEKKKPYRTGELRHKRLVLKK